jgi:hypothetical protein
MPQNPTSKALEALRAIVDAGGPSVPVRASTRPTSTIEPLSAWQKLTEKILPTSDEPLAQRGVLDAITGGSPRSESDWIRDAAMLPGALGPKGPVIAPEAYRDVKAGGLKLYSRLTDTFAKAPKQMMPDKVRSLARSGASGEEISLRKLEEFLTGRPPMSKIPQEEVMRHLEANPLELDVVRKGGHAQVHPDIRAYNDYLHELETRYGSDFNATDTPDNPAIGPVRPMLTPEERAMNQRLYRAANEAPMMHPESVGYDNMQTPGPKENYGESLINLPPKNPPPPREQLIEEWYESALRGDQGHYEPEELASVIRDMRDGDFGRVLKEFQDTKYPDTNYTSPHWHEPNNLVWSRHNDRRLNPSGLSTDTGEGVLNAQTPGSTPDAYGGSKGRFIEEIQSDWHQQGRERGYNTPEFLQELADAEARLEQVKTGHIGLPGDPYQNIDQWSADYTDATEAAHGLGQRKSQQVPDAPFKDTYHELALKQQLLDAADQPDLEWLGVADADTAQVMEGHIPFMGFPEGQVPGSGIGRRPGMDQFYNERHPSALEKLLKPFGGDVEYANLPPQQKYDKGIMTTGARGFAPDFKVGDSLVSTPEVVGAKREPLFSFTRPDSDKYNLAEQSAGRPVPGPGFWKANLTPEMKQAIKERGFPAMVALLALQSQRDRFNNGEQ